MSHRSCLHPLYQSRNPSSYLRRLASVNLSPPERTIVFREDGSYLEPYVGYRAWRARANNGRVELFPLSWNDHPWQLGVNHAACLLGGDHAPPANDCGKHGCGIFAYRDPRTVALKFNPRTFVMGEVHLHGRVKIHEYGFRAERAEIAALWEPYTVEDARRSPRLGAIRLVVELASVQYEAPLVKAPPGAHKIIELA